MNNAQLAYFNGLRIHENHLLTVRGPDLVTRRSWVERIFSLPWRPLVASHVEPTFLPDPHVYRNGAVLIAHQDTIRRMKKSGAA